MLAEEQRQRLYTNPIFNIKDAYKICDYARKGEITYQDLKFLLEQRGHPINDLEMQFLLDKFDRGFRRGSILEPEFISEFIPRITRFA